MSITRRPQRAGFNSAVERASRGADAKEHEERIDEDDPTPVLAVFRAVCLTPAHVDRANMSVARRQSRTAVPRETRSRQPTAPGPQSQKPVETPPCYDCA